MKKIFTLILLLSLSLFALDLTPSSFNSVIKSKKVVLVEFWAPWCAPCGMLKPEFDKAKRVVANRAVMAKYNVDLRGEVLKKYKIDTIPTMVLFVDGKEVDRTHSVLNSQDIAEWVLGYVPK